MRMKRIEYDTLSDFFTNRLMNQVTNFKNFNDFLVASGFNVTNAEEFDNLSQTLERDNFIAKHSQFKSWTEMKNYFRSQYYGC